MTLVHTAKRILSLPTFCLLVGGWWCGVPQAIYAGDTRPAFWVWNRAEPLTSSERAALQAAGVERLYWQAGELELHAGKLGFRRTVAFSFNDPYLDQKPSTLAIIPVVRVSTAIHSPEQFSAQAFGQLLRPVVDASPGREVQIDFDCPDRLLPLYAEHLRAARLSADIRHLTITALAGWANVPASTSLWPVVDAVFPMLYDTVADSEPAPVASSPGPDRRSLCQPRPLVDRRTLEKELRSWSRCPVPWYAGLPVFGRTTLYDPTGHSRGNLRSWDWEDLVFNPALILDRPATAGVTVLRAIRPTRAGESILPTGGFLAWREAEPAALEAGMAGAAVAGARGIVFFRLPDPPVLNHSNGGGRSLAQLLAMSAGFTPRIEAVRLHLHQAKDGTGRWVLQNDSDIDLPPRFAGDLRGYGLELEIADRSVGWRDAVPGEFRRVGSHTFNIPVGSIPTDDDQPVPVAIPFARRLTFWFAELPAHASLTSGLVQVAPGVDPKTVQFRLPGVDHPETTPWQSPD